MHTGIEGEALAYDVLRSEWIFTLLIIPVLLYLFVSMYEKYSLIRIIKIVFSNKFAHTSFRNVNPGVQIFQMLLGLLSFISISTFLLLTELHFNIIFFDLEPVFLWIFNLALISLVVTLRFIIINIIGFISNTKETFKEYFFNISRSYKLIGILMMIMNFFIVYLVIVPDIWFIYLSFLLITIIMIFRVIRLIYIFLLNRLSLYYMILYLCALEIFPVLIIIRYLGGQLD